jgi:hypothetical protein
MKMKTLFRVIVLLFATALSSCEEEFICCPPMDNTSITLKVMDAQGQNLLDPKLEKSFRENTIKIFYEENGKLEEYYNGGMTNMRRNFKIQEPELEFDYRMKLILKEKTVIQWNTFDADTLQAEIEDNGVFLNLLKVYHQGELKWDATKPVSGFEFTIIK